MKYKDIWPYLFNLQGYGCMAKGSKSNHTGFEFSDRFDSKTQGTFGNCFIATDRPMQCEGKFGRGNYVEALWWIVSDIGTLQHCDTCLTLISVWLREGYEWLSIIVSWLHYNSVTECPFVEPLSPGRVHHICTYFSVYY